MIRIYSRNLQSLVLRHSVLNCSVVNRGFCEKIEKNETSITEDKKLSGFAKAFEKHAAPVEETPGEKVAELPFATLLRNSKLVNVS